MPFYKVVAAINGKKVELTAKFDTAEIARASLHKDGYSIIEIHETTAPVDITSGVFYFEIIHQWQRKSWKIQSDDILKAYKKLVDELKYELISISTSPDASQEDKAYTTAKVREAYDEYKRRNTETEKQKTVESKKNEVTESTDQDGYLAREVKKYQTIISAVYNKMELFINTHSEILGEERISKIKELLPVLRQMRQGSNIDKLRIVWEASLLKIWELEIELLALNKNLERSQFLKETNALLKDLWSTRRVWNDFSVAKKKISQIFQDIFASVEPQNPKTPVQKADTGSFVILKNLRELSIYKERLAATKKEILRSLFWNSAKRKRLILKKRLIEQNIQIIESRISKKTFSYTKLAKGIWYYEDVIVFIIKSITDIVLYSLALAILVLAALSIFNTSLSQQLFSIVFVGSVLSSFVVIFNGLRSFITISLGSWIFFLVSLALQINF